MTFFALSSKWTSAWAAVIGLGACQMVNPAFEDEGQADEVGDEVDTSAGESTVGESSESDSNSESNDASTDASSSTTDPSDAPDGDWTEDDTIEPDLPVVEECMATFSEPFRPIYGTPEAFGGACPITAIEFVKVLGNGPAIGLLDVQPCAQGCSSCDGESRPLGVIGLEEFTLPLLTQLQDQQLVCLMVQTGAFRHLDETRCLYDSLWVGNTNPVINLLLAVHRVSPLPAPGNAMFEGKGPPVPGDELAQCSCATVYEDPADAENLGCCESVQADPFVSSLVFLETAVAPGNSANVLFDGGEWGFHVAQTQLLPTCENNVNLTVDMSWALVRGQ